MEMETRYEFINSRGKKLKCLPPGKDHEAVVESVKVIEDGGKIIRYSVLVITLRVVRRKGMQK